MILVTKCFEITDDEGETIESGFLTEDEPFGFRELVDALRYGESSRGPARGETREWVSQDQGERETHTFHFSRKNPPHVARYWRLAFRAAGLSK